MNNELQTPFARFLQKLWWKFQGINCITKHCHCFYENERCCKCKKHWSEETFETLHPQDLKSIEVLRDVFITAMKVGIEENDQKQYLFSREALRWMNWLKDNQHRIKL